jgi:hypothetical protein
MDARLQAFCDRMTRVIWRVRHPSDVERLVKLMTAPISIEISELREPSREL